MKTSWVIVTIALLSGCGPHYTIPNFETDEVEKVVSSGRSAEGCIENLKEDAKKLNLKVRLIDVKHEATSGPISWIYANTYHCTGKVVKSAAEAQKAL
jgi:hypothetical protein